jgi:hypothetical protein
MNGLFLGRQISEHRVVNTEDARIPFGPLGQCMYCENTPDLAKLTLEHIIPKGLGGNLEFEKSSCKDCARITGRNEQMCLRGMFDVPRAIYGLRKRKHKDASTAAGYQFIQGTVAKDREAEFSKHPPNFLPFFDTKSLPGILLDLPEEIKLPCVVYGNIDQASMQAAHDKEGGRPRVDLIKVELRFNAGVLSQMLAKIAHSYTVSQIGLTFKPLLQSHISYRETHSASRHSQNWKSRSGYSALHTFDRCSDILSVPAREVSFLQQNIGWCGCSYSLGAVP